MVKPLLNRLLDLVLGMSRAGQTPFCGLSATESPPSEDEIGGAFFSNQRCQSRARDRRIASQGNLREAPFGVCRGKAHVADHGQLCATAQAGAMNFRNGDLRKPR